MVVLDDGFDGVGDVIVVSCVVDDDDVCVCAMLSACLYSEIFVDVCDCMS